MADYSKWVLRKGMKVHLKGNSEDYGIKDKPFQIDSDAIITFAPHNKRKQILVLLNETGESSCEEVYVDRGKIKWNPENVKVVGDFEELKTFQEFHDMLNIFTFEQILTMWNETETSKGKYELFDVERIYDICYVDTDFEEFLEMLEEKGISVACEYGEDYGYIQITDIDGRIYRVDTREEENRFDEDFPTETIVYWDTVNEYVREKEKASLADKIAVAETKKDLVPEIPEKSMIGFDRG